MTTLAPPALTQAAHEIESFIPSAVFSGIIGNAAHRATASKHNSIEDNKSGTWPVVGANDAAPPGGWSRKYAVAIDISMNRTDQNRIHAHFKALFNDKSDARRKYIAAFNGWDGNGSPGRYNLVTGKITTTDSSHKWHEHVEGFYRYALDPEFARAVVSLFRGETSAQFLEGVGSTTPSYPATLVIDGKLGPKTITRWQQVMGTPVDGVISPVSDLVKAVQRHLNEHGASPKLAVDGKGIRQDGKIYQTVRALQRYLGTPVDGKMSTPKSLVVRALQSRLNTNQF